MSTRHHAARVALVALAAAASAAPALGAGDLAGGLRECSAIATRDERLACFDRLAAGLPAPVAASGAATAPSPAPAAKPTPRVAPAVAAAAASADPQARFGFSATQIEQAREAKEPDTQRLEALSARVASTRRMAHGGWLITLDNGQVWRQVSPSETLDPVQGSTVTIKPASFGSFLMVDGSRHSARVHREK